MNFRATYFATLSYNNFSIKYWLVLKNCVHNMAEIASLGIRLELVTTYYESCERVDLCSEVTSQEHAILYNPVIRGCL
jgi:hypothetical protein